MDVIPPELMAQIAERDQAEAADCSATRVRKFILAQPKFAITREWFAQVAAVLAGVAESLPESHREHAEVVLGEFSDAMRCELP